MARTRETLTGTFQQVATGRCVITVDVVGNTKTLVVNDIANGSTAMRRVVRPGDQIIQDEDKATFALGAGIEIIVDQE